MKSIFSRRSKRTTATQAQTPAPTQNGDMMDMAAQVGNQNMEQIMNNQADSEMDPMDPLGLGNGEDREAWLANLPGAEALYQQLEARVSKQNTPDPAASLRAHQYALSTSTKAGGGPDSDSFRQVKQALHTTLLSLDESTLSGDVGKDTKTLYQVIRAYSKLVERCGEYTKSHKALSVQGRKRKNIVKRIESQANQDLQGFRDYADSFAALPEEQRATSVKDILGQGRRRVIQLKQGKESDLKHVGGAASYLGVINQGDATDESASGFFKEQESYTIMDQKGKSLKGIDLARKRINTPESKKFAKILTQYVEKNGNLIHGEAELVIQDVIKFATSNKLVEADDMWAYQSFVNEAIKCSDTTAHNNYLVGLGGLSGDKVIVAATNVSASRNAALADELKEIGNSVVDLVVNRNTYKNPFEAIEKEIKTQPRYQQDEQYRKAIAIYEQQLKIEREEFGNASEGQWTIQNGESINLSNRNVATSRIANLLGIGDVVAQSETAELKDAEGGGSRIGNLMQKAKGKDADVFFAEKNEADYDYKKAVNPKASRIALNSLESKITPQYMKSLSSLQVLDNLVGQMDRHQHNFFIEETEDGKAGKVQGIDNDYSFSNTNLYGNSTNSLSKGKIGQYGISIAQGGKLTLPYMDAKLADNILNLEEDEARLALQDLLEPWAIDSFCLRLAQAKKVISEAKELDESRFLTDDRQWNNRVYQEFAKKGEHGQFLSYIGKAEARQRDGAAAGGVTELKAARAQKQQHEESLQKASAVWSQAAGDPAAAEQLLRSGGVKEEIILHMRKRGLLQADASVLEQFPDDEVIKKLAKMA